MTAELFSPNIDDQIEAVIREIVYREHVYPRRVAAKQMTQKLADRETDRMRAVLDTLRSYRAGMVLLHGRGE